MQAKQIIEGNMKRIKNDDQILKDLSTERLRHCKSCVLFDGNSCDRRRYAESLKDGVVVSGCGCNMAAKVLVYGAECPLSKWKAKATPLQLLTESESWMKVTKEEFTNGDETIFFKNGTWYFADIDENETVISSYDIFLQLINN